jgi:hypothetical protein
MGHATHFLQRLDTRATRRDHVEFMMGLYHDHELVKYVLANVKLPPDAARVAFAADESGNGPHVIIARDGGFVTCLGNGMNTHPNPVVSRAQVEGLRAKVQRTRDGLALANKRGLDATRAIKRIETLGPGLSREDFVATAALLGPATTVLTETYAGCVTEFEGTMPFLMQRDLEAGLRRDWTREVAGHAWGMAHAAIMHVDNASREWVEQWAQLPAHARGTPWLPMLKTLQVPFVARAAWIAARLGKVFLPLYKGRFAAGADPFNLFESGWGLVTMAARHAALRGDAVRALQAKPDASAPDDPYIRMIRERFAEVAQVVGGEQDEGIVTAALGLGRQTVLESTRHLGEDSRYHFADESAVPDELALPALLELPLDAFDVERGFHLAMGAVLASVRVRAEEFYFPATFLHARGPVDLGACGDRLVEMNRALVVSGNTVKRETPKVGRNDPCPCGSGKKYKKCHGA